MRLALILLFACFAAELKAEDTTTLAGNWKASPRGDVYYFMFAADSSMKIVHGADTTLARYTVTIDSSAEVPMQIDLHVLDRMSGELLYTNKGIFEVFAPGKMRLRWSENMSDRPKSFMPKGNPDTLILVRQK